MALRSKYYPNQANTINFMKNSSKLGFSLIELSIVILVIGILVIGITKGSRIMSEAKLKSAQSLTNNSPVASISNLVFWLDATDDKNLKTSTVANIATTSYGNLSDTSPISAWNDRNPQSTNKITTVASSDGTRPVYIADGINGLPSVNFVKANSQILSSSTAPISRGSKTYTLIAVFKPISLTSNAYLVSQSNVATADGKQGAIFLSTTDSRIYFNGFEKYYGTQAISTNSSYISIVRVNNNLTNNIKMYTNNSVTSGTSSGGGGAALDIGTEIITIGARTGSFNFFDGLISEIIIYNKALTDREIDSINSYLSTKYAIKLN